MADAILETPNSQNPGDVHADAMQSHCVNSNKSMDENGIKLSNNINKSDQSNKSINSSLVRPLEDAVEKFLAGTQNCSSAKYNYEDFENLEPDNEDGIDFKSDNMLDTINENAEENDCTEDVNKNNNEHINVESEPDDAVEAEDIVRDGSKVNENYEESNKNRTSNAKYLAKALKRRSIRCLNKMQIMEDVREGCDANPPSSPGHAEQRQAKEDEVIEKLKTEEVNENGVEEQENGDEDEDAKEINVKEEKEEKRSDDELYEKQEDNSSDNSSTSEATNKRKLEEDEAPLKRLKTEIEDSFVTRDKIINDLIGMADCSSMDEINSFSEQILMEIKTLNDLAKEKEREWNHILHMKKIKEELLIRLQRKRQVLLINDSDLSDLQPETNGQQSLLKCNQKLKVLRDIRAANIEKLKQRTILPKSPLDINSSLDLRQKQKPLVDVQSIIADYRQRHPEVVPRRGRRIRNSQGEEKASILGFSGGHFTFGQKSGLDTNSDIGMFLNCINGSQDNSRSSTIDSTYPDNTSYKDILVQFAKLSQSEKTELQMHLKNTTKPPPPYPEVTVHPVTSTSSVAPTNSLLHGILTKAPIRQTNYNNANNVPTNSTNNGSKSSFSPTLARLLTAPEKAACNLISSTPTMIGGLNSGNVSISEIFCGSKARNEITITPVGSQFETTPTKTESMEEESEEQLDRLVIDESSENLNSKSKEDNSSENGEDVPQCQGCNQKPAQFVCAGCGNQWYCSRNCQVTAWDDHSEVCSG